MIVVKVIGGLGNQLFQYAAGLALAQAKHTDLKLDISDFKGYNLREFDLDKIIENLSFASDNEIRKWKAVNLWQRLWERLKDYPNKKFYKEPYFHYDSQFPKLENRTYIQGYFQSEKYFLKASEHIRAQLSFKHTISPTVEKFASDMNRENSVSIHLRKGDYKDQEALKVHGVLPVDYYLHAIEFIRSRHGDAKFYLFSDDPEASRSALAYQDIATVSGRVAKTHFEDLYLMSQCKHNIIANSSFSWWGAWLNANPEKIVIAPKKWFNNGPQDTQDLIPGSWIRL